MTLSHIEGKTSQPVPLMDCGLWLVCVVPTESIDLHVVGDLALCEQTICSPAKQASCKQYTLGACQIFEQAVISIGLKDNLETMLSCDSCRDQLITVGPVRGELIVKVYRVLLKQECLYLSYFLTPKLKRQFIFNIEICIIERKVKKCLLKLSHEGWT